jgi:hypothetical protein
MDRKIIPYIGIFTAFIFATFLFEDDIPCNHFLSAKKFNSTILSLRVSKVFCRSTGLFVCHLGLLMIKIGFIKDDIYSCFGLLSRCYWCISPTAVYFASLLLVI